MYACIFDYNILIIKDAFFKIGRSPIYFSLYLFEDRTVR